MKIRVVYNEKEIVSVDRPDGAAAIDYDMYNLAIADHSALLPQLSNSGYDVSKISEMLIQEGITITNPNWIARIETPGE